MKVWLLMLVVAAFASAVTAQDTSLVNDETFECSEIVVPTADQGREYSFRMALSPDGQTLAVLRTEHDSILFYSTVTHQLVNTIRPALDKYFRLAWSPDGTQIAVSGELHSSNSVPYSYDIVIWNLETMSETARQTNALATSLAWSPAASLIAFVNRLDNAAIWELEQDTTIEVGREADDITWTQDGSVLAGVQETGYAWVWFAKTDELVVSPEPYWFDALAWSPDGQFLALSSSTFGQYIYNVEEHADALFSLDEWAFHSVDAPVSALAWSPGNNYLAATSRWGLALWDVRNDFEFIPILDPETMPAFDEIAWMPDGESFLALSEDGVIYSWDVPCLLTTYPLSSHHSTANF